MCEGTLTPVSCGGWLNPGSSAHSLPTHTRGSPMGLELGLWLLHSTLSPGPPTPIPGFHLISTRHKPSSGLRAGLQSDSLQRYRSVRF